MLRRSTRTDGSLMLSALFCRCVWVFLGYTANSPPSKPNICVLLDVGTRPHPKSIYHLWKAFDKNSNVGGACGEIRADTGKHGSALLNPIVASQK